jgi:hypothetical protein
MDPAFLILFGLGLALMAFLIWMLFPLRDRFDRTEEKEKPRGKCPLCDQILFKGERLRSSVTEIGNVEVQTRIKGCPYCMGEKGNRKRACPVCKKKIAPDEVVLALADPRVDRLKLSVRGCKNCYPQGF